jgi:hypothetical protein
MADIGITTTVAIGSTTDASNFTTVALVKSVTLPMPEVGDVDVTNLDSANATKEYVPGLIEPGEITMQISYGETATSTLFGYLRSAGKYCKVTLPTAAYWMGKGYVKKFGTEEVSPEGEITNSMTFKLSEKPTYTTA